jgi:hypothetical protein
MFEAIASFKTLESERRVDLSEPHNLYKEIAAALEKFNRHDLKARASFIRDQCAGFEARPIFQKYREKWGIPIFRDDLVNLGDFKRGFLYRFRDHVDAMTDSAQAKHWFLHSEEARMTRRYERWSREGGFDECKLVIEGNYKEILVQLLGQGDYAALQSAVFSKSDLDAFMAAYKPKAGDPSREEVIRLHLSANPNYAG